MYPGQAGVGRCVGVDHDPLRPLIAPAALLPGIDSNATEKPSRAANARSGSSSYACESPVNGSDGSSSGRPARKRRADLAAILSRFIRAWIYGRVAVAEGVWRAAAWAFDGRRARRGVGSRGASRHAPGDRRAVGCAGRAHRGAAFGALLMRGNRARIPVPADRRSVHAGSAGPRAASAHRAGCARRADRDRAHHGDRQRAFLLIGTLAVYLRELLTDAAEVDESSIGGIQPGTGGRGAGGKAIVVAIAIEDCGETAGRPGDQALLVDNVRGPVDAIAATLEQGATRAGPGRSLTSVSGVRATRTFARCASRMPRLLTRAGRLRQPARLPGVKAGRIVGPRRRAAPRDVRHATPEGSAMGVTFA